MTNPAILASLGLPAVSTGTVPPPSLFSGSSSTVVGAMARPSTSSSILCRESPGFSLGHGFPLIPSKLVFKIEQFEFFTMAEILPDNIELSRKTEAVSAPSTCLPKVPKKREFSHDYKGLLAWVICFSTYAARKNPERMQQFWAYQATIVREALRFDCQGWIGCNTMFRQQVAKNHETDWSSLVSMFYSLTFLSESVTCSKCMSPDHSERNCALNYLEDSCFTQSSQHQPPVSKFRAEVNPRPPSRRRRRDGGPAPPGTQSAGVCYSWNEGQCLRFPKECERKHSVEITTGS